MKTVAFDSVIEKIIMDLELAIIKIENNTIPTFSEFTQRLTES